MLTTVEKVLFLKSVGIFSHIPGEDLAQIAQIAEEVSFKKGATIFEEGDPGDSLYLIIQGKVRIHKGGQEISILGEKECFGEMAILDNESRSASVTTLENILALKIGHDDFYEILSDKIEIAQGIFKVLTKRLRDTIGG
ncbi:MAG: cyclic nucleotide-binding domain-containing protein [Deltaproteobacteria bacterium]|nr:MAG: cyclic nucleotide-binding domain-containing protein [Deltaproteobacteria bacterium]